MTCEIHNIITEVQVGKMTFDCSATDIWYYRCHFFFFSQSTILRFLVFLFSLHGNLVYEIDHVMCIISYTLGSKSFACY